MVEFVEFSKIKRLSRECIITEKIDGTNAQIFIPSIDSVTDYENWKQWGGETPFLVGSRTRWITPDNDNYGFARWCYENAEELLILGPGRHYGEWWGSGINRGYGLPKGEKRWSLFNTVRWCLYSTEPQQIQTGDPRQVKMQDILPACCSLVPVLYRGIFNSEAVEDCLTTLFRSGSQVVPDYMNPEGVIIYHIAGNVAFKKTLGNDGHKGGKNHEDV